MSEVSQVSNSSNSEGLGRVGALNENPSLQITTVKLDGSNYLAWSRSALLSIKSRGMVDYLTGKRKEPDISDPAYAKWDSENSLVMSWLIHSMQPEIGNAYFLLTKEKCRTPFCGVTNTTPAPERV